MNRPIQLIILLAAGAMLLVGCSGESDEQGSTPADANASAKKPTPPAPHLLPPPKQPTRASNLLRRMEGRPRDEVASVKGPWAPARVGQWVQFRTAGGQVFTSRVVSTDENTVTLSVSASGDTIGEVTAAIETVMPKVVSRSQQAHGVPVGAAWTTETVRIGQREVFWRVASWHKSPGGKPGGSP